MPSWGSVRVDGTPAVVADEAVDVVLVVVVVVETATRGTACKIIEQRA